MKKLIPGSYAYSNISSLIWESLPYMNFIQTRGQGRNLILYFIKEKSRWTFIPPPLANSCPLYQPWINARLFEEFEIAQVGSKREASRSGRNSIL